MTRPKLVVMYPGFVEPAAPPGEGLPFEVHTIRHVPASGPGASTLTGPTLDFGDESGMAGALAGLLPIHTVLVWPALDLRGATLAERELRDLMNVSLAAVKAALLPLVTQRTGFLWVARPRVALSRAAPAGDGEAAVAACVEGLASLAGMVAPELAKRGVTCNFLDLPAGTGGLRAVATLLRWTTGLRSPIPDPEPVARVGAIYRS